MIGALDRGLRHIGHMVVDGVWKLGAAARFSGYVLIRSGDSVRRFQLTLNEIYFSGTLSLIIIIVSGLFVGLVLGLQGYETLKRYGSAEALGTLVALALVRELGPVVSALLFASRAGSAITAKIGIMKATEQLSAMEMMAVDPFARVLSPIFWGGVFSMPLLAAIFSAMGVFGGYLIGVVIIGVDSGRVLVPDAGQRGPARGHSQRGDQEPGVRRGGDAHRVVRRLRCAAHRRGRVLRRDAHGGDLGSGHSRSGLRSHLFHVHRGLTMKRTTVDLWVGVFVTAGVVAILTLALKVGNATSVSASDGYMVYAHFENIGGLKPRAPVKSAGVVVGRVEGIALDPQKFIARVMMRIRQCTTSSPRTPRRRS